MRPAISIAIDAHSPQATPLALHLLGAPKISCLGRAIHLLRSQTRALLYRLGAKLEPIPRDELIALFWSEMDDNTARQNLHRLLSLVRYDLPAPDALVTTSASVQLDPRLVWSDSHMIEELTHVETVDGWLVTVDLYSGPFLSDFSLRENAEYEHWQRSTMERLRDHCLAALDKLINHYSVARDYQQAVKYARRYLEINGVAETVHCQLINLYSRLGQRDLALRQFEECVLVLERELGVDPLPATRAAYLNALHNRVSAGCVNPAPAPSDHQRPTLEVPLSGRDLLDAPPQPLLVPETVGKTIEWRIKSLIPVALQSTAPAGKGGHGWNWSCGGNATPPALR